MAGSQPAKKRGMRAVRMAHKVDGQGRSKTKDNTAQRMENDLLRTDGTKVHTGEQIPDEVRQRALDLLAKGGGINETAEQVGINKRTLMAIRTKEVQDNPAFATKYYSTRTPARLLHLANQAMERMSEEMESLPVGVLPVVMGVALDKYMTLTGQATAISEVRHHVTLSESSGPAGLPVDGRVIDV